jgi:hypothetical protein
VCRMASRRPETITVMFTDLGGSTAWRTGVGELVADLRTADDAAASLQHLARRWAIGGTGACLRIGMSTARLGRGRTDHGWRLGMRLLHQRAVAQASR